MDQNNSLPTIMIVEDFDDTRQMLAQWLSTQNFRVVEAKDGWEAVGVAVHERPGLILMDLNLPVLDGVEVICLLREHGVPLRAGCGDHGTQHGGLPRRCFRGRV